MVSKLISRALFSTAIALLISLSFVSCNSDSSSSEDTSAESPAKPVTIPPFSRDSAYAHVETQLSFGTREPGSEGIERLRAWMKTKLESYGAKVYMQEFEAEYHWGETIPSANVIGAINPDNKRRIVLAAHFDTRRIGEEDEDEAKRDLPIPGADDGGSGVGVLLEIARIVSENEIDLGIDFVFFDAEDQGIRGGGAEATDTWCLGSQHWSRQPHTKGYKAEWGILLDMVGAENATFNREDVRGMYRHSQQLTDLYNKVWNLARSMGKTRYFTNQVISPIIDDHYYVNKISGIPMIDIINKPANSEESFGAHWHTHDDDIDIIDKNTLGSVGQVVTAVIYRASAGRF